MRITSGKFKSRIIRVPKAIRPTLDNVRKAIFDILGEAVIGTNALDLFAGSGALGIEALSRGANSCVFVDNNKSSVKAIRENLEALGLTDSEEIGILFADVLRGISKFSKGESKFDLIFLDPPYYKSLAKKSLSLLGSYDILTKSGVVIVEHSKHDELPSSVGELKLYRSTRYGDTCISFYHRTKIFGVVVYRKE